jgi:hypothetical protein
LKDVVKNSDERAWLEGVGMDDESEVETGSVGMGETWEEFDSLSTQPTSYEDERNHESVQSRHNDFTFVARGNQVSLFKEEGTRLFKEGDLPPISNLDGENFSPTGLMLHNYDSQLLMLNQEDPF